MAIDVVFPAMHGTYGEDGALMGLLDMANVPYVGCGIAASAIAMDKVLAKQLAAASNIPVSKFLSFTKGVVTANLSGTVKQVTKALKYPLFVNRITSYNVCYTKLLRYQIDWPSRRPS